jgi:hypothetical protein
VQHKILHLKREAPTVKMEALDFRPASGGGLHRCDQLPAHKVLKPIAPEKYVQAAAHRED